MSVKSKDELRKRFFALRKDLGAAARQQQSDELCQVLLSWYRDLPSGQRATGKVAMTIKFGTEPDTDPVMHALHAAGVEVWVPISHADRSMSWTLWAPDIRLEKSTLGPIAEPVGERFGAAAVADADVVFVPALAADTAGYRLGKGGGYYDRFLAQLPELTDRLPLLVTPVFNQEFFAAEDAAFPVEAHDLPVQAVATAATGVQWV